MGRFPVARILTAALLSTATLLGGETAHVRGWPDDWMKSVGKTVILEGTAQDGDFGARLVEDTHLVWIDGLDAWPKELSGKRLRVTGVVILRNDLPYRKEGERPPPDLRIRGGRSADPRGHEAAVPPDGCDLGAGGRRRLLEAEPARRFLLPLDAEKNPR